MKRRWRRGPGRCDEELQVHPGLVGDTRAAL